MNLNTFRSLTLASLLVLPFAATDALAHGIYEAC